jgi:putative transposase
MARLARLAVAGLVHQLIQRGNNGQDIFIDRPDRESYLHLLREAAAASQVAIHAYALTDKEVILLATPDDAVGLSRMMQAIGRRYVARFNRRHGRSGTLWEGRFRATVIEAERYLHACICFVELAPVRAALAREAQDHPWSSARHHLGLASDPLVTDHALYWAMGNTPFEREAAHRELLERALTAEQTRSIVDATMKGWALGSDAFKATLEEHTQRRVQPGLRGRPRKGVGSGTT